jgi:REP element-mobilizing transposase RayT
MDGTTMWNRDPPPGFQGLHPDRPVTMYQRHLPHWRQDGATYFVTFRLGDALPQSKLRELEAVRADWERRHPPPHSREVLEQLTREVVGRVERWLDQGMGSCLLRQRPVAAFVTEAMHHFDGDRYELAYYVVMPNHVHAIVRPLRPESEPLDNILGSWKQFSAGRINKAVRRRGELWQEESFDRIVRDEEHLYRAIQYIGANPARGGLPQDDCPLWIRPEWEALGWTFERRSHEIT